LILLTEELKCKLTFMHHYFFQQLMLPYLGEPVQENIKMWP